MSRTPCVVGVGMSAAYSRGTSGRSEYDLVIEAVLNACADAGIDPRELDGLAGFAAEESTVAAIIDGLRLESYRFSTQPFDPSGGGIAQAVDTAAQAVLTGRANYIALYRGNAQAAGHRYGRPGGDRGIEAPPGRRVKHHQTYQYSLSGAFSAPFGASVPVHHWAIQAQRHMHMYGTTSEQFGAVAVSAREHARRNPAALMRGPMTIADHQESRMISSPLRLYDCCLESDAAGALIITTSDRAKDCRQRPVSIRAAVTGTTIGMTSLHTFDPYPSANLRPVRDRLWNEAGIGPADVDVAQIYDHFTSHVLMAFEDLGFCGIGEGGAFVDSGAISWPHGSIPTNTSGGQLSEVYTVGMNLLAEGVRQIRGTSTAQVEGAEISLVTSGGASCPTGALIFGTL